MADETNNKNAVFKFYLNRQGVKGNKGEKGDQGFSPIIEVSENTAASYKLQITTETDQIETPNLRGNAVEDLGGTYMRFNTENQTMYAGTADVATTSSQGEVTLASDEAIANLSDTNVLTPNGLVNNATSLFQSTDGSIAINQDENTGKINLATHNQASQTDVDALTLRVGTCEDNITNNAGRIQTLENDLALDEQAIQNNTSAIGNKVDKVAGKGLSTNDFTNEDKDKLTHAVVDTDLANVAFTGSYTDLINTPAAYSSGLGVDISNTNQISAKVDGTTVTYNLNGELTASGGAVDSVNGQTGAVVLTASDVGALPDSTVIPTVNNPTITFTQGGTTKGTITLNQSNNQTIALDAGGGTVDQTYDATSANAQSGVAIAGELNNYVTINTSQTVTANKDLQGSGRIATGNSIGSNNKFTLLPDDRTSSNMLQVYFKGFGASMPILGNIQGSTLTIDNVTRPILAITPTTHNGEEGYVYIPNLVNENYKPYLNANKITSTGGTVTITDNGMNGINIEAVGGGGGTPTNMMTTDTDQYVTGTKTSLRKNIRYIDSVKESGIFNAMWLGKSGRGCMGLIFDSNISNSNYYLFNQGYQTSTLNVEGFKNFKIIGETENRRCYITNANLSKGSTPSSTEYIGLLFDDRTGREGEMSDWVQHRLGNVEVNVDTSGTTTLAIDAYRNYGHYPEGTESTGLKLIIDSSGNKTATINTGTFSRTDGTNTYKILDESDNTKFDGQWVKSNLAIASQATAPNTTAIEYDLSSYLPNDNYDYEVFFSGNSYSAPTSGSEVALILGSSALSNYIYVCRGRTTSNVGITVAGSVIIPIPVSNRKIIVTPHANNSGTFTLNALGYRRIGTNS